MESKVRNQRGSRNKGAVGERELCKLLSDELGITVERNVDQARRGGADCYQLPGFTVEIKRREALDRDSWWEQTVKQAVSHGGEPICWYRQNRKQWRALLTGNGTFRDVGQVDALDYIRDKLQRLHGIYA
jgi:hypothetical protein